MSLAAATTKSYAHYQAGTLDVHDYVRLPTRWFTQVGGLPRQPSAQFMREVIAPAIRPQARWI